MIITRKDWASKDAIIQEVADVPENWLRGFALRHPTDCRKFAATRTGSMMYRVEAVLKAIEDGESMPNAGIIDRSNQNIEATSKEVIANEQPSTKTKQKKSNTQAFENC